LVTFLAMVAVTLAALPVAALVIWGSLRSTLARRIVAAPTRDRWHERETPLLGGVGIFAGLMAGVGAAVAFGAVDPLSELGGILGGCALLFAVGLVDDAHGLSPLAKIAAQVAAVGILFAGGLSVEIVGNDLLAFLLGALWLVGMTNAFNLLDNMDGVAATLAGIACGFFAIDAVTAHPNRLVLVVALSLALACAGFLPFNLRPGRRAAVFMGDSGSQVLGFTLGAIALAASWKAAGTSLATVLLPILVLAVPILDTTLVTVLRLLERRPLYAGGRDHTSHRLVYHGLSEGSVVVLLAVIAAALGATSLAYNAAGNAQITLVGVLVTFALLVEFAAFLAAQQQRPAGSAPVTAFRGFRLQRGRLLQVVVDFALVTAAFASAYVLRFEGIGPPNQRELFTDALPVILAARYATFILFGLYSSVWRFAGAREAARIVAAVALSEAVATVLLAVSDAHAFGTFSRSVFVIDAVLCTVLIGASRFSERALARFAAAARHRGERRRTLIVGAGRAARSLLRELNEAPGERVIGFVDDDPSLRRRRLDGVPVLGDASEIDQILTRWRPDAVLVTIPDAARERLDFVIEGCARAGVPCQFVRRQIDLDPYAVLGRTSE
jgi:UDP-GlcNAc:undecaprenyl-phosphate/decaprenyl-phosphate GlcNAc-1-phosphate transferase